MWPERLGLHPARGKHWLHAQRLGTKDQPGGPSGRVQSRRGAGLQSGISTKQCGITLWDLCSGSFWNR